MKAVYTLLLALLLVVSFNRLVVAQPALLLFGGTNHKIFLGCLSCNKFDTTSVCNSFGAYGSRFADTSIWNRFSDYGSRFSDESPWNRFATNHP